MTLPSDSTALDLEGVRVAAISLLDKKWERHHCCSCEAGVPSGSIDDSYHAPQKNRVPRFCTRHRVQEEAEFAPFVAKACLSLLDERERLRNVLGALFQTVHWTTEPHDEELKIIFRDAVCAARAALAGKPEEGTDGH